MKQKVYPCVHDGEKNPHKVYLTKFNSNVIMALCPECEEFLSAITVKREVLA